MGYLDNTGLAYFWNKIKGAFGSTLSTSGQTVTLKSKLGTTLSTITTQDTTYSNATSSDNGLMSSSDKAKLDDIASRATNTTFLGTRVELTVAGWSDNTQTISVSGVTKNSEIISRPDEYYGVQCIGVGTGTLKFYCSTLPTDSIHVDVMIFNQEA